MVNRFITGSRNRWVLPSGFTFPISNPQEPLGFWALSHDGTAANPPPATLDSAVDNVLNGQKEGTFELEFKYRQRINQRTFEVLDSNGNIQFLGNFPWGDDVFYIDIAKDGVDRDRTLISSSTMSTGTQSGDSTINVIETAGNTTADLADTWIYMAVSFNNNRRDIYMLDENGTLLLEAEDTSVTSELADDTSGTLNFLGNEGTQFDLEYDGLISFFRFYNFKKTRCQVLDTFKNGYNPTDNRLLIDVRLNEGQSNPYANGADVYGSLNAATWVARRSFTASPAADFTQALEVTGYNNAGSNNKLPQVEFSGGPGTIVDNILHGGNEATVEFEIAITDRNDGQLWQIQNLINVHAPFDPSSSTGDIEYLFLDMGIDEQERHQISQDTLDNEKLGSNRSSKTGTGGQNNFAVNPRFNKGASTTGWTTNNPKQWLYVSVINDGSTIESFIFDTASGKLLWHGEQDVSGRSGGDLVWTGNNSNTMWLLSDDGNNVHPGAINFFRVYNYKKTRAEVEDTFFKGYSPNNSGLVADVKFEEGSGTDIKDEISGDIGTRKNTGSNQWISR